MNNINIELTLLGTESKIVVDLYGKNVIRHPTEGTLVKAFIECREILLSSGASSRTLKKFSFKKNLRLPIWIGEYAEITQEKSKQTLAPFVNYLLTPSQCTSEI